MCTRFENTTRVRRFYHFFGDFKSRGNFGWPKEFPSLQPAALNYISYGYRQGLCLFEECLTSGSAVDFNEERKIFVSCVNYSLIPIA